MHYELIKLLEIILIQSQLQFWQSPNHVTNDQENHVPFNVTPQHRHMWSKRMIEGHAAHYYQLTFQLKLNKCQISNLMSKLSHQAHKLQVNTRDMLRAFQLDAT